MLLKPLPRDADPAIRIAAAYALAAAADLGRAVRAAFAPGSTPNKTRPSTPP
ncbi:hypothetical protein [Streptomyces sp. NPDC001500]